MTQHAHLDPAAFYLEGGRLGVLLIHGFTGAPPEMRLIGDYLHEHGCTVSAPLLPGHGTDIADMRRVRWTDWTGHVERAYDELRQRCNMVFVGGLSMGAVLALYLAAQHAEIAGAVVYSPAVFVNSRLIHLSPLVKHLTPVRLKSGSDCVDPEADLRLWSYDGYPSHGAHELLKLQEQTRRLLPLVKCPVLVVYSTRDQSIRADAAAYTYERAGSADKELVTLNRSGHCITVDGEWRAVAERTVAFIRRTDHAS